MHFDALTLAAVAAELRQTIGGGRVQQVLMTSPFSIGLEVYARRIRRYLLLSAEPTNAAVYLVTQKLRRGTDQEPPLFQLLRKYVRGAAIDTVLQPDPTERLLRLGFDHPEHGATTLVVEPMGRTANLMLLGAGERILDCLHRVRPADLGGRVLLPNHPYTPPGQTKLPPVDDGRAGYYEALQRVLAERGPLWKALIAHVTGLSPSSAREVAWRATGAVDTAAAQCDLLPLLHALQEMWAPVSQGGWTPGVWLDDEQIVGYSPYAAHVRGRFVPTPTVSEAIEQASAVTSVGKPDAYAGQRRTVQQALTAAQRKVQRRLDALAGDAPAPGEVDRLRAEAAWLLALAHQVAPGQSVLDVPLDGELLTIRLDPVRTPVEQAQRMYQRAAKLARAADFIPHRQSQLETDRAFLEQLQVDLTLAENQPEIAAVQDELRAMGLTSVQRPVKAKSRGNSGQPLRYRSAGGFDIVVGRNARQNEHVTFQLAAPEDLWLHARGVPGAHVVVRQAGRRVDEATLVAAAQLAAHYSRVRGERAVVVMITEKRFVSRLAGGRAGQVTVRNEKTVTVPAVLPDAVTLS